MADLSKLKKRSLGAPPSADEASENLTAPEIAPVPSAAIVANKQAIKQPARNPEPEAPRIDGRSLRKTHRTVQLATKVSPEYDAKLRMIAQRDGLLICELLEKSLDSYESRK